MDFLFFELRHALRAMVRNRTLTLSAASALALGVGATTTLFSIVHGATRGLPFERARELVAVTQTDPRRGWDNLGAWAFDYRAWSSARSFQGLAGFSTTAINLGGGEAAPERRSGALIEPRAFTLLGVQPSVGRGFTAADAEPGSSAVLISHDLWQARYGGDEMLGKTIRVNGEPRTVIGIMPKDFGFPIHEDVWLPLQPSSTAGPREGETFTVFGRLRDGATLESAQAELAVIAARLAREHPETHGTRGVRVLPFAYLEIEPSAIPMLYIMLLAVSFVLVIACANVANLLIARAAVRSREFAVRAALGASRKRIALEQLLESLLVAGLGGAGGLLLAYLGVGFFDRSTAHILEAFWIDFRIDRMVLLFTLISIAGAGLLAGLVPALRVSVTPPAAVLKESTNSGLRMGRLSRALVVAELALACGLLVVSGILVKAAVAMRATRMPFQAEQIYTAQIGVTSELLNEPQGGERIRELTETFQTIPGVKAAALASVLPGRGAGMRTVTLDGLTPQRTEDYKATGVALITPGFLEVLGGRVLQGRGIEWRDDANAARVALVNASWVKRFSAERDPIGRTIELSGLDPVTIIGVVPDLQMQDPEDRRGDGMYLPMTQNEPFAVRLLASTGGAVLALTPQVHAQLSAVDPDLPLFEIATLRHAIFADKAVLETFGTLFALFGAGALFLTVIGLYGVVSFGVTQRTRELGIRMSLGAQRSDILRLVLKQGGRSVGLGAGIGLLIGFVLSTALSSAFEWMPRADPWIFAGVVGALGVTAVCALVLPARRAARLDPLGALRFE